MADCQSMPEITRAWVFIHFRTMAIVLQPANLDKPVLEQYNLRHSTSFPKGINFSDRESASVQVCS